MSLKQICVRFPINKIKTSLCAINPIVTVMSFENKACRMKLTDKDSTETDQNAEREMCVITPEL